MRLSSRYPSHPRSRRRTARPSRRPRQLQKRRRRKTAGTTSQRLRVWRDVDYIAEDVTVRYVKPAVAPQKRPMGSEVQPEAQRIQPMMVHAPEKPEIKQISGQHKTCEEQHM